MIIRIALLLRDVPVVVYVMLPGPEARRFENRVAYYAHGQYVYSRAYLFPVKGKIHITPETLALYAKAFPLLKVHFRLDKTAIKIYFPVLAYAGKIYPGGMQYVCPRPFV